MPVREEEEEKERAPDAGAQAAATLVAVSKSWPAASWVCGSESRVQPLESRVSGRCGGRCDLLGSLWKSRMRCDMTRVCCCW
eukprot:3497944-Rhodomonas_salina.2